MARLKKAWEALLGKEAPKPAQPSAPPSAPPTPPWVVGMTIAGAVVLGVIGFLVLLAGYGLWKDDTPPRVSDRPSEISLTIPAKESATPTEPAPAGEDEPAPQNQEEPQDQSETGDKETSEPKAEAAPTEQITAKWPTSPATRNETLALALLGTGAALLLAGAFAPRITSIKLPGGSEFTIGALTGIATAVVVSQAEKEGKPDIAKDPQKLAEGARMLIEQVSVPVAQAAAVRSMGPLGVEAAFLASPDLEQQAKRVVEDLSADQ